MDDADKIAGILKSLDCPLSLEDFKENVFESTKWLCAHYNERPVKMDESKALRLKELLGYLPIVCNKKELLIALLGEVDHFNGHEKFLALLNPIQECLRSVSSNCATVVEAYDALCAHLESVPLPQGGPAECVEFPVEDGEYSKTLAVAEVFLDRFGQFVDEVHTKMKRDPSDKAARKAADNLSLILVRVFARPLAHLQLDCCPGSCELLCLSLLEKLQPDAVKFLTRTLEQRAKHAASRMKSRERLASDFGESESDGDVESVSTHWDAEVGLGVMCHLVFRDAYAGDLVPQVFSKVHLLEMLLPVADRLLRDGHPDMQVVDKGCSLVLDCLRRIGEQGFEPGSFDAEPLKKLVDALVSIVSLCRVRSVMHKCIQCMNSLLWAFQPNDRLAFLSFILRTTNISSIQGFAVTAIKNQLSEVGANHFDSDSLLSLLRYVFALELPKVGGARGPSWSVINRMDRLMSTLNFLIYLVIKGSYSDGTIEDEFAYETVISHALANFVKPLRQEVDKQKFQCVTELEVLKRNVEFGDAERVVEADDDSEVLGREDSLKWLLVNLDLLESSINRVETLLTRPGDGDQFVRALQCMQAPPWAFEPIRARYGTNTRVAPFN